MVTPLHLAIVLHYHTRTDQFELVVENDVRRQFAFDLVNAGLLDADRIDGNLEGFCRTDGLEVWIKALCSTPFPVKRWVMPGMSLPSPEHR